MLHLVPPARIVQIHPFLKTVPLPHLLGIHPVESERVPETAGVELLLRVRETEIVMGRHVRHPGADAGHEDVLQVQQGRPEGGTQQLGDDVRGEDVSGAGDVAGVDVAGEHVSGGVPLAADVPYGVGIAHQVAWNLEGWLDFRLLENRTS